MKPRTFSGAVKPGPARDGDERSGSDHLLKERVVARANACQALKRVRRNKGSPGIDGMTVSDRRSAGAPDHPPLSGAGIMADGVVVERYQGTPQGGPLSPLLANVLLDDVDKELERRGHCFVRYADDCNVYVRSKRAGERVLAALRRMYAKLRLRVNEEKSAVARASHRKFLGYSFWVAAGGVIKRRVAATALEEMQQRVRQITSRNGGRSMEQVTRELGTYLRGWKEYFKLADTPGILADLDGWIHRRLRAVQLKQWKRGRTPFRALTARGLPEWLVVKGAGHGRRWWWASALGALHTALPGQHFERLGVPRLVAPTSTH